MADYRQIQTRIWSDSWFVELGAAEKLLFIYLFSNSRACLAGIYDLSLRTAAFETDLPTDEVARMMARFQRDGKVYFEDGLVWVPSLVRCNANNLTSAKIQANLRATLQGVRDCGLKRRWMAHYNMLVPEQYRMDMGCMLHPEPERPEDRVSIPDSEPERTEDRVSIPDSEPKPTADRVSIPCSQPEEEQEQEQEQEQEHPDAIASDAGASAPKNQAPTTFQEWHGRVTRSNNPNAMLRDMIETLFPGQKPPSYQYIGRVAQQVGGAGRLADLVWQAAARPPTGDLLRYCQGMAKGGNGRAQPPPDPAAVRERVYELLREQDGQ